MFNISIQITGEVEKFIVNSSRLYGKSKESVVCDLIAKGYSPDGEITGEDISVPEGPNSAFTPGMGKPAHSA